MHLAKLFALMMASVAAAAPSIAYSQISVKVTNTAAQNHGHVVHSFQEVVTSLPFNFTLSARLLDQVRGPPNPSDQSLPFGFASRENFPSGILGTKTEFTFRNGKLIVGNYVLSRQPARFIPPQVALWPLEYGSWFHLVVFREISASGKTSYFLEHADRSELNLASFVSLFFIHSISTNVNWWT